jgi:hypothetical protein
LRSSTLAHRHNSDEGKDGRLTLPLLAVTRLAPGQVCHVAYIDVKANFNANEPARKAADETARLRAARTR